MNNEPSTIKFDFGQMDNYDLEESSFYLDCHFFAVGDVDAQVDVAEAAAADLPDEPILAADDELAPARQMNHRSSRGHRGEDSNP